MHLCAIFLTLSIGLTNIFASPPNPVESLLQANHGQEGYECGDVFFTIREVKRSLTVARASIGKGYPYPQMYQGNLYSDTKSEEYFVFPIRQRLLYTPNDKGTVFRIMFKRDSIEVVDVVAKVPSGDHAKCIRRGSANIGLSGSVLENLNGYQCALEFFADEIILQSLTIAQTQVEANPVYPSPYRGLLYPDYSEFQIWPIMKGKIMYRQGSDGKRNFVDVVIKGYSSNFLRCLRSRKPPKAPASDQYSKLFVQPPRNGYACGKKFFNDNVLEETAEIVKKKASKRTRGAKYPLEYNGPPFYQHCLIWPISPDGKIFRGGIKGPYRLILTPEFRVMNVALYVNGVYERCEKSIVMAKKNHDTSSYDCHKDQFSHEQLEAAAEEACEKMKTAARNNYPADYVGSAFQKKGPYLTYPLTLLKDAGLNRVVINTNCEIVGALTTVTIGSLRKMVKCHREDDGPTPPDFFGADAEAVSEHKVRI